MPERKVSISEAVEKDTESIAAFLWAAWREAGPDAPGFVGASDAVLQEITARDALLKRLGGPHRRMFVAKEGSEVVGFSANRRLDSDTVELAGIVVLRRVRGLGVGTRLLKAAVDGARRDGYRRMLVRTEADNQRAKEFYEKEGFEFVRAIDEEIGDVTVELWELSRSL